MPVTIKTMKKHEAKNPVLHCQNCGCDYSATPGDYFYVPEDEVFTCVNCDEEMILAVKRTVYKELR